MLKLRSARFLELQESVLLAFYSLMKLMLLQQIGMHACVRVCVVSSLSDLTCWHKSLTHAFASLNNFKCICRENQSSGNNSVESRVLASLLTEIDGVSSSLRDGQVTIIAATNRIDFIDAALIRKVLCLFLYLKLILNFQQGGE